MRVRTYVCACTVYTPRDEAALDITPTESLKVVSPVLLTQTSTSLSPSDTDMKACGYSNVTTGVEERGEGRGEGGRGREGRGEGEGGEERRGEGRGGGGGGEGRRGEGRGRGGVEVEQHKI